VDNVGCFGIKIGADTAKFTKVSISGLDYGFGQRKSSKTKFNFRKVESCEICSHLEGDNYVVERSEGE